MKTKLLKSITGCFLFVCALASLIATMTLGTPATARAAADGRVCSVGMLKGLYLWTVNGYASIHPNLPIAVMSGKRFNGDGTLINDFGTVNVGGSIIIDGTGEVGTYTVAPDCTGTISVPDTGASFNIYVGPGAKKLWFTQTQSGFGLGVGTAERLSE